MPWNGVRTVEQKREEFVQRVLAHEGSIAQLCREYGISRPTGYKWIKRIANGETPSDKSRRPFHTPNRIPEAMELDIISRRLEEPALGATKIRRMMHNEGIENIPSARTVNNVLKRNSLISKEASEAATPYVRFQRAKPNEMWQMDFKGDYAMQNGKRCYPLSIIDDCSRFCLCADAKTNERLPDTRASLIEAFRVYGLPQSILCDNGNPWGASQSGGITRFDVWMMELGIHPIHIRSKHPQTQGKVERFNGSFKQERLKFYIPADIADAQRQRLEYREFYNERRPHHALDMDTPAEHYKASSRPYREEVSVWEYEAGGERHMVKSSGYLTFKGQGYFLSEGLGGKEVFIYPCEREDEYKITFRGFVVARLNAAENTIFSRKIYRIQSSVFDKPSTQKV